MLKKITLFFVATVLPLFAMAQTVKLGYINSQEVMMMMPEVNNVEKELAEFNEKNMKYLQEMESEIQNKYAKYEQEKDGLTEAIRKVQEEELMSLQQRLQTTYQALQQETQKKTSRTYSAFARKTSCSNRICQQKTRIDNGL